MGPNRRRDWKGRSTTTSRIMVLWAGADGEGAGGHGGQPEPAPAVPGQPYRGADLQPDTAAMRRKRAGRGRDPVYGFGAQ